LIAPGWLKLNASVTTGRCWYPFGISKKFGNGVSQPADTIPPILSEIKSETGLNDAVIVWNTNEKSDSIVFFGTTAGLNVENSTTSKIEDRDFTREHSMKITGLTSNTKYYFVIKSKDKSGNAALSAEFNFTTKSPVTQGDVTPPMIRAVVASVNNSSVSVGWITNEPATSKILYGTTSPLDVSSATTTFVESGDLKIDHLVTVPNLSANTKYYLVIQSKDAANNIQSSTEFSATTGI
ncbi:MAG: fibronectin type III domain-containing protein, partial [Candidatus Paceibacterota bacterium]